ncbi:hypothetical protein [Phycisphaera mikurensis]|uniref:Uncharacterized protein n=1 Tax=Phycisphaera mikurensis (strain NBRC 102666 / KCTC 22515 / FYK2301M01) TaxID=1142394 RepID=I0IFV1_PHYMF|nr:hypothetical protein [Phycisphaera mikurensis]MBB6440472.1 hypothetical protein [Phycisphaera mikurensis]BAM04139.1 hypothetical protein PSMK_19800 [Phycisphaera mikurensis NBRC 102666]
MSVAAETVLLRHAQRGDSHLDWMIDLPDGTDTLRTFRCAAAWSDFDRLGRVGLLGLAPHRRAWLTRQGRPRGPRSAGRGRVLRLARGTAEVEHADCHGFHLRLAWPAGPGHAAGAFRGRVVRLHRERFEFLRDDHEPPAPHAGRFLRATPPGGR